MYKMIYFFGPDGVGKTTHANLIAIYLIRRGYKVWRTGVKQHHTIAYLLLKLMSMGNYDVRIINYYGFHEELTRKLKWIWRIIEFLGIFPVLLYRVHLPMLLGYVVVCDRYVLDTLVTLSYFLKEPRLVLCIFARILIKLIPKNSLLLYFDADNNVIMLRKRDEPLNVELIKYYKRMYTLLMKIYSLKVEKVNTTTEPIQTVQEKVANLIGIPKRSILR